MPATLHAQKEEVFEGRALSLHVASEGLALSTRGVVTEAEQQLAGWDEVTAVDVQGGAKARVVIGFRTERPMWVIAGMRRSHAEWARRAVEAGVRAAARASQPACTQPLSLQGVVGAVEEVLAEVPVSLVGLGQVLISQATLNRASDVHLVPSAAGTDVHWRVDGLVQPVCRLPEDVGERLVSCLKSLAGLASYCHDIIQEGRITLQVLDRHVELRLTVLPTLHGETLTLRVFDPSQGLLGLEDLGFEADDLAAYRAALGGPGGLIVLTGPAGAGKTTTMYASLQELHQRSQGTLRFATVEDPVERDLGYAAQTAVRPDQGISFATALATVLRQDPNVMLVGEIRDPETAEIAVRAGMTGHLVLTTLHAGSSAGVLPRLAELGIAPFLSSSAVRCLVSQRLLPKLCACATSGPADPAELAALGLSPEEVARWDLRRPVGCESCGQTGRAGRLGVLQVAPVTDDLRALALAQAAAGAFDARLRELGVPTLHALALRKASQGLVALADILTVMGGAQ